MKSRCGVSCWCESCGLYLNALHCFSKSTLVWASLLLLCTHSWSVTSFLPFLVLLLYCIAKLSSLNTFFFYYSSNFCLLRLPWTASPCPGSAMLLSLHSVSGKSPNVIVTRWQDAHFLFFPYCQWIFLNSPASGNASCTSLSFNESSDVFWNCLKPLCSSLLFTAYVRHGSNSLLREIECWH